MQSLLSPAADMRSHRLWAVSAITGCEQSQQAGTSTRSPHRRGRADCRRFQSEQLGSLDVDHKFKLCRLHNGQLGRFGALEHSPGVDADLTISVRKTDSIAHKPASLGELTEVVDRWHSITVR